MRAHRLTLIAFAFAACARAKAPVPVVVDTPEPPSYRLAQLAEEYFEELLVELPSLATAIGDGRYDDRLEIAIDEEFRARTRARGSRVLERLATIPRAPLDAQGRVTHDVLRLQLTRERDGLRFPSHLLAFDQWQGLPHALPLLGSGTGAHPFRTAGDYDNFLRRVTVFPRWVDTAIANMRRGIAAGIVQPRPIMERALPQLAAHAVADPEASTFWGPVRRFPDEISPADRERLTAAWRQMITTVVAPAYRKLHDFTRDEYLPRCRDTVALSALPDGRAWYRHAVGVYTTLSLPPDDIFATGMREVQRIRAEMEKVRQRAAFTGDLRAFAAHVKTLPPRYETRETLTAAYEGMRARVEVALPKFFGRMPRAPFEIRPIEEFREASAPSQYHRPTADGKRPGIFYFNASGLKAGPMKADEGLFIHEALPGHHYQIAIQQEIEGLPRFRRFGHQSAYSEGWGLYVETLGKDLGLYATPDQQMSSLTKEIHRAARLVIDVGLHWKGWSRKQARDFLADAVMGEQTAAGTVDMEIDRYIAMPGQALAYKIGQLEITALRAEAEKRLGARFDVRAFHDQIVGLGAVPLEILRAEVHAWIAAQR